MKPEKAIERLTLHKDWGFMEETTEAIDAGIAALKKQIPMKAYFEYDTEFDCPACGTFVEDHDVTTIQWCPECGQRLRWED